MHHRALCTYVAAAALLGCSGSGHQGMGDTTGHKAAGMFRLRAPLRTRPWVSDFRLAASKDENGRLTHLGQDFSPGEPVYLSMQVNDVPRDTVVTTYWYGPNNLTLGFQTQTVASGRTRLRFELTDTSGWEPGAYRAEIWIGDDRIETKHFNMVER